MQEQQVHLQALQVIINGLVNFSSILLLYKSYRCKQDH